ncbi:hypothetical protein D3C72_2232610 [compost metagenome]
MEAGCDVGGTDQSHQGAVFGIADTPAAEGLAQITIDVYDLECHFSSLFCLHFVHRNAMPAYLSENRRKNFFI